MKLRPMTDFVIQQQNNKVGLGIKQIIFDYSVLLKYAQFLKQPLTLGMFVPCDLEGNILKEPIPISFGKCINKRKRLYEPIYDESELKIYLEAKERVLFKDAVTIDLTPYKSTKRLMINLNHPATFRIYNKFNYNDGHEEISFLPNFSKVVTIEYLIDYGLELTESAKKQIGL